MVARRRSKKQGGAKKASQPVAKARKALVQRMPRLVQAMDQAAIEWSTLLQDPCNAKLSYPCYPVGTGGTVLIRLEADTILWAGGTEVAGYTSFIPGLGICLANFTALTSDAVGSTVTRNASINPGDTFITTGSSLRCVAACTQVMYPGSELNRSGVVAIGVQPASAAQIFLTTGEGGGNTTASAAFFRGTLQHTERMPSTMMECKWFPGDGDAEAINPQQRPAAFAPLLTGHNAIVVSASGFPVGTGVRIRNVGIYEMALNGSNQGVTAVSPPASRTPVSAILKNLFDRDPQWYLDSAYKAARFTSNVISYARAGAKAAGTLVNGMALIAA